MGYDQAMEMGHDSCGDFHSPRSRIIDKAKLLDLQLTGKPPYKSYNPQALQL